MDKVDEFYDFLKTASPDVVGDVSKDEFRSGFKSQQDVADFYDFLAKAKPDLIGDVNKQEFVDNLPIAFTAVEKPTEDPAKKRRGLLSFTKTDTGVGIDFKHILGSTIAADMVDRGLAMAEMAGIGMKGVNADNQGISQDNKDLLAVGFPASAIDQTTPRSPGFTTEDFKKLNELRQSYGDNPPSKEASEYFAADNITDKIKTFFKAPFQIMGELVGESLVAYVQSGKEVFAAGLVGQGIASAAAGPIAAGIGTVAATGIASYRLEAGTKYVDTIQEEAEKRGLDLTKQEDFDTFFSDLDTLKEAKKTAQARGLAVGLFDAATAHIASGILTPTAKGSLFGKVKGVAKSVALESTGGGAGEIAGQIASGEDLNLMAAIDEAIAEVGPGVVTIGSLTLGDATSKVVNKARHKINFESDLAKAVVEKDPEKFDSKVDEAVEFGQLTQEQADELKGQYSQFSEYDNTIPESVSDTDKRARIVEKIKQRNDLENKIIDPNFADDKEAEIEKINKEIKTIAKEKPTAEPTAETTESLQQERLDIENKLKERGLRQTEKIDLLQRLDEIDEGLAQPQKPEAKTAEIPFIEDFKLQDKEVELQVINANTGKKEAVTMNALEAQNNIKKELDRYKLLKDCLLK